ncbi:MAG: Gfo/Idh/MocA family oxidoreductase [Anaerolineales bacterium]
MKLRGALIGCGYISTAQLKAWDRIDEVEVIAVCDLDYMKAEAQAKKFEIPNAYKDFKELLQNEELDFVDIATRPSSHLCLVTQAAQHGIHVICQKPLTNSMPEAQAMTETCQKAGVTFMINENLRWQAWFRQMKKVIEWGEIGTPLYARFDSRWRSTLPSPNFEGQEYFGRMKHLIVYEMGVHYFDTCRYLFGEADQVYAVIRRISPEIDGDDFALITCQFGELTCSIDMDWFSVVEPQGNVAHGRVRVEGDKGTMILGVDGKLRLYKENESREWVYDRGVVANSFVDAQRHFVQSIIQEEEPETSGEETIKTLDILMAAYLSGKENRVVQLSEDFSQAVLPE